MAIQIQNISLGQAIAKYNYKKEGKKPKLKGVASSATT
jgi:hypothetical protein